MNWALIGRSVARYTVGYAGTAVLAAAAVSRSELAMLGIVALGFLLLLVVAGGIENVRPSAAGAVGESAMFRSGDPEITPAKAVAGDLKLLFLGLGFVGFGFAALVALGELGIAGA